MLETHAYEQLRRFGVLCLFSEDPIERLHHQHLVATRRACHTRNYVEKHTCSPGPSPPLRARRKKSRTRSIERGSVSLATRRRQTGRKKWLRRKGRGTSKLRAVSRQERHNCRAATLSINNPFITNNLRVKISRNCTSDHVLSLGCRLGYLL